MIFSKPPPARRVLLRLTDDVAAKLARAVAPRKRNQFLIDLIRRELEKEDLALVEACKGLNRLETGNPALRADAHGWIEAGLTAPVDEWDPDFDAETFSREAADARAAPDSGKKPRRRRA